MQMCAPPNLANVFSLIKSAQQSLLVHVDYLQSNCLNESAGHTLESIVRPHKQPGSYLLSDVDEQLLLNISVSLVL